MDSLCTPQFPIPDCRTPGHPMASLPLKLPQASSDQLDALAARMGCSRSALGRALLLHGLQTLAAASEKARPPLAVVVD